MCALTKHVDPPRPNCPVEFESGHGTTRQPISAFGECEGCGFLMHAKRCTNPESERWEEYQACGATEFTFPLQYSESLLQQ